MIGSGRGSLTAELWGGVLEGEQAGKEQGTKTAREEQGQRMRLKMLKVPG